MAKSARTGGNRGRRSGDRKRAAEQEESVVVPLESLPSSADDRGVTGTRMRRATKEEVAQRAYEIFTARGGTHGYDIEDWLQAERELNGE